jgi:bifunctional isochorismate lyase/aryl carrier protein
VPVFYSAQPAAQSPSERGLLSDMWGPGLTAHPERQAIVPELLPTDRDVVLTKVRYSAFHRTELSSILQAQGRDQLIICGVYAHIGCMLTACDAFMHDVQPFFVTDAVADFSPEYHKMAIDYVASRCAVTLESATLLSMLGGDAARLPLSSDAVRALIAETLELPVADLGEEDDLFDLGLDSIRLMTLVEAFRGHGATASFEELAECRTLRAVSALLGVRGSGEWPVSA